MVVTEEGQAVPHSPFETVERVLAMAVASVAEEGEALKGSIASCRELSCLVVVEGEMDLYLADL